MSNDNAQTAQPEEDKGMFGSVIGGISSGFNSALDATKNVANATVDATKNAANATVDATKNAANATVDATKNAANATANAASNVVPKGEGNDENAVAADDNGEEGIVATTTHKVLDPTVDNLEVVGLKTMNKVEDLAVNVTELVFDKTEDLSARVFGSEKTEKLKELGGVTVGIATQSFHSMGGIANEFACLTEDTANQLWEVACTAGNLVAEEHPALGEKVNQTIKLLEDTTEQMSAMAGESSVKYWSGTRTQEERQQLLLEINSAAKGTFGVLLKVLVNRENPKRAVVPRIISVLTSELLQRAGNPDAQGLYSPLKGMTPEQEEELEALKKRFEEDDNAVLEASDSSYVIGQLLILFFRELPSPLLLQRNYEPLKQAAHENDKEAVDRIAQACAELPMEHQVVLDYMIDFFNRLKAHHDAEDIAREFGPVFCTSADDQSKDDEDASTALIVMSFRRMLEKQREIAKMTQQFRTEAEIRSKHRQADNVAQLAATEFIRAMTKPLSERPNAVRGAINSWEKALSMKNELDSGASKKKAEIMGNLAVAYTIIGDSSTAADYNSKVASVLRQL